jgi:hypothetical protein
LYLLSFKTTVIRTRGIAWNLNLIDILFLAECKDFFAKSLFVVGEFGGNDYNAPLFAGQGLEMAYKFMRDVIQGISDGVEVALASLCCVLSVNLRGMVPITTVYVLCRH